MSRFARAFGVICVFVLWGAAPADADGWHLYTAPDGAFAVRFPVSPETDPDSNGHSISASPSEHETFILEYTPLNKPMEDQSARLFAAATKSFTDGGGTVLALTATTVEGHPAQDTEVRSKEGYVAWDRLVAVNDRVYQLLHISDSDSAAPSRFWASFTLQP